MDQRLEKFADLINAIQVDIVLVQEIIRTPNMNADYLLGERLRMSHIYLRANGDKNAGFEEGLAVFSRFPLSDPIAKQLGVSPIPFVRRMALGAEIDTPCGDLFVLSVHLGVLKKQNLQQHDELQRWVDNISDDKSVLIGGDFNAPENSTQIKNNKLSWLDTFRHLHPHTDGTTHELRMPCGIAFKRSRLDYIFLRNGRVPWRVLETGLVMSEDMPLSDHQFVLTRIRPATT